MFREIVAAFFEYKYLSLAFFAALALMVFLMYKASKALARTNRLRDETLERLRREKELCDEFSAMTREKVPTVPAERLIRGAAALLQKKLESSDDMTAAFSALTEPQQYLYALNYVFFEDAKTLSEFFRKNGKPLTVSARDAVDKIAGGDAAAVFSECFTMLDGDDETVSVSEERLAQLDEKFAKLSESDTFFQPFSKYIAENLDDLLYRPDR